MENFYEQLKNVCKEHDTTIYAIEKATGASKGSFIKWRNSSPSADKLIEIADLLGVSMDYLLGREIPQTKKAVPMERPEYGVAISNYQENCESLASDEKFVNITHLYANLATMAIRSALYGELVKWLENRGVDVAGILGL